MKTRSLLATFLLLGTVFSLQAQSTSSQHSDFDEFKFEVSYEQWRGLGSDYDRFNIGMASALLASDYGAIGISFGAGDVELRPGRKAALAAKDPYLVDYNVFARAYFTSPDSFCRPYVAARADFMWLGFTYRDPNRHNDAGGNGDSVLAFGGSLAAGLAFQFSSHVSLFGEGQLGAVGVSEQAAVGPDINFLDSFTYVGVKVGFTFTF